MSERYYDLRLTEKQMRVLKDVCELRFRIDLLQSNELTEILATMNCLDLSPENPRHREIFDSYIERREHIDAIVKALFEIASPMAWRVFPDGRKRNPDSLIAEDIWQCIRYQLWQDSPNRDLLRYTVDSREPLQESSEPLPTIKRSDR